MKIVVQRVSRACVRVNDEVVGEIDHGLCLLVCLERADLERIDFILEQAAQKILALRIFQDEQGKMNLSLKDKGGSILAISQFTLSWDGKKGNRPSFDLSMEPISAQKYFEQFCYLLKKEVAVECGRFGASMQVEIINEGPVTFSLSF